VAGFGAAPAAKKAPHPGTFTDEDFALPLGDEEDDRRRRTRKPARIKLKYRQWDVFVKEYRSNLDRNGAFIRTEKPLAVGRECVFEVDAPGLRETLVFDATVVSVVEGRRGQDPGMEVRYRLGDTQRAKIEAALRGV
jgi:hypothetical protein